MPGEISMDQIRLHEDRSRLLNSLGAREPVQTSKRVMPTALETRDAFLLASDGFWECVNEPEMEQGFSCGKEFQAMAAANGGRGVKERAASDHDNYSAMTVRVFKSETIDETPGRFV